jgi:hypothetical protein
MRVAVSLDLVDDESVGSDLATNAIIRIAGRQHRHLQQPGRPQHEPDLAEPAAEVAQRAMMDHIPRQDVIEAGVGKRQGVGEALVGPTERPRGAAVSPARCLGYCVIKPPSITSSVPVMNEASSETRNSTP